MSGAYIFTGTDKQLKRGAVYILKVQSTGWAGEISAQIDNEKITSYPIWQCPYASWTKFRQNWDPIA